MSYYEVIPLNHGTDAHEALLCARLKSARGKAPPSAGLAQARHLGPI